jgi:hypothetical protein
VVAYPSSPAQALKRRRIEFVEPEERALPAAPADFSEAMSMDVDGFTPSMITRMVASVEPTKKHLSDKELRLAEIREELEELASTQFDYSDAGECVDPDFKPHKHGATPTQLKTARKARRAARSKLNEGLEVWRECTRAIIPLLEAVAASEWTFRVVESELRGDAIETRGQLAIEALDRDREISARTPKKKKASRFRG